jgi:hypothetical protein
MKVSACQQQLRYRLVSQMSERPNQQAHDQGTAERSDAASYRKGLMAAVTVALQDV